MNPPILHKTFAEVVSRKPLVVDQTLKKPQQKDVQASLNPHVQSNVKKVDIAADDNSTDTAISVHNDYTID